MFNRILVCLDGSRIAEQVMPYVVELAERFVSQVLLLNVYCIEKEAHEVQPITYAGEEEAKAYLNKKAESLMERAIKVECDTVQASCVPGSTKEIGDAILNYAQIHEVDIIAIATHGRSGWRRVVFGSVAEFVLENSSRPLLVVRPRES